MKFAPTNHWHKQEPSLPGAGQIVLNGLRAIGRNGANVLRGGKLFRTEESARACQAICEACTEWYRPSDQRCAHSKCGCYLRLKPWFEAEHCPVGRW